MRVTPRATVHDDAHATITGAQGLGRIDDTVLQPQGGEVRAQTGVDEGTDLVGGAKDINQIDAVPGLASGIQIGVGGFTQYAVDGRADDSEHQEMIDCVKDLAESSRYSYGSRRMKTALNAF